MKNIGINFTIGGYIVSKSSINDEPVRVLQAFSGADRKYPGRAGPEGLARSELKIALLGKCVAPGIGTAGDEGLDRILVEMALNGQRPEQIARTVGSSAAEVTIRLVELRTGPIGCVRPASGQPVSGGFANVKLPRSQTHIPQKQRPILSLIACAFGDRLQRLGDRLYLGGEEMALPDLVRLARERGVRIRYPRLDPMDSAWIAGPSCLPSRKSDALLRGWLR